MTLSEACLAERAKRAAENRKVFEARSWQDAEKLGTKKKEGV